MLEEYADLRFTKTEFNKIFMNDQFGQSKDL